MELRGPGEVYGVRQSGIPDLKLASITDLTKIYEIRNDIEKYLHKKEEK
jgi:ATP-dependent DNA helicase RecG